MHGVVLDRTLGTSRAHFAILLGPIQIAALRLAHLFYRGGIAPQPPAYWSAFNRSAQDAGYS